MAFEEEPIHVSSHRLAVDTISVCLLAVLSACPASANPPTPNLRPCINHRAWRTESQRWVSVVEVGGGRGGETRPIFAAFSPEAIWTEGKREKETKKMRKPEIKREKKIYKKLQRRSERT